MIVVDTNLIVYLYVNSEHTTQAEQALLKDSEWVAPLLWRSEFRNVLARYLRKGLLTLSDTRRIMNEAETLMHEREYQVRSRHVLELAASSGCSAYDCEFVATAQDLAVPLVTVDKKVLKQFPTIAISLEHFVAS